MFCIIEGRLTILERHILYNSGKTAQREMKRYKFRYINLHNTNEYRRSDESHC